MASAVFHTYSENILVKPAFAAAAMTNSTQNGPSVDTAALSGGPYRRAAVVADLNPGAATTANVQLQDSPDGTTWTSVAGATLGAAVAASTQQTQIINVDLAKRQRYLRLQVIGTGTAGAASASFHFGVGNVVAPAQAATALFV